MGANPRGPLRACSLAVRASLTSFIDEAGAPPALVVGLSGGADSLALALTTIDVAARAGIPVITLLGASRRVRGSRPLPADWKTIRPSRDQLWKARATRMKSAVPSATPMLSSGRLTGT